LAVTYSLSLQPQCFSYKGSNGEVNWLGLERIQVAAKLTTVLGLSLYKSYIFYLSQFFLLHDIWEKWWDKQMNLVIIDYSLHEVHKMNT
jgi:hypothetical protein